MAKPTHNVQIAECPECESIIRFHEPLKPGQIIVCPECREKLEVQKIDPLKLDWAFDDFDDDHEKWD